jgi:hypothetical protein
MKHHANSSAAKAIADALSEATSIARYRIPPHPRASNWQGITRWILLTNAEFNPNDQQRWQDEVVPVFQAQGLAATYWGRPQLDAMLQRYPEVYRAFFENKSRVFLTTREAEDLFIANEPFYQATVLGEFHGRDTEISELRRFLSGPETYLVVEGTGGIGKSRLLLECGTRIAAEGDWLVLWANIATLTRTHQWFEGLVPERPTLILLDEPDKPELLSSIHEQMSPGGRGASWKVVIGVRSANDPILDFLNQARMRKHTSWVSLEALSTSDAEAMCRDLLEHGTFPGATPTWIATTANALAKRFSGHPIWLALAVRVLEERGKLAGIPEEMGQLADEYLRDALGEVSHDSSKRILELLRWIALLGSLNRQNPTTIDLLLAKSGIADPEQLADTLSKLVARRLLKQFGIEDRMLQVKPDVLRDHILSRWLTHNTGYGLTPLQPARIVQSIVDDLLLALRDGEFDRSDGVVLLSLARTEKLLRVSGHNISLLDNFFAALQQQAIVLEPPTRFEVTQALVEVAPYAPAAIIKLSELLLQVETTTDAIDNRTINGISQLLRRAAVGARAREEQSDIVRILCEVLDLEVNSKPESFTHLRSTSEQALAGLFEHSSQLPDFSQATYEHATHLLNTLRSEPPSTGTSAVLRTLLGALVKVHRVASWSDTDAIHMQHYSIQPGGIHWTFRAGIVLDLRKLLASEHSHPSTRLLLWPLLSKAHKEARGVSQDQTSPVEVRTESLNTLKWAYEVLNPRRNSLLELKVARDLWHWHVLHDPEAVFRHEAAALENLYLSHPLSVEFGPLLGFQHYEALEQAWRAKATQLEAASPLDLAGFVERAIEYLGGTADLSRLSSVSRYWGRRATEQPTVRDTLLTSLESTDESVFSFALDAATAWVNQVRRTNDVRPMLDLLLARCATSARKVALLKELYCRLPPWPPLPSAAEAEHLLAHSQLFEHCPHDLILAVALALADDLARVRQLLDRVLSSTPSAQLPEAVVQLVAGSRWAFSDGPSPNQTFCIWLLNHVFAVPAQERLAASVGDNMRDVMKVIGPPPLSWLADVLDNRIAMVSRDPSLTLFDDELLPTNYIKPIAEPDETNSRVVQQLLDRALVPGMEYLPQLVRQLDPKGLVAPGEIAARVTPDSATVFAGVASQYPFGSSAWKVIAISVLRCASNISHFETRIFQALSPENSEATLLDEQTLAERQSARDLKAEQLVEPELAQFRDWLVRDGARRRAWDQGLREEIEGFPS